MHTAKPSQSCLPLQGKRVVLTRPIHQTDGWTKAFKNLGAHVVLYPVLTIDFTQHWEPFKQTLQQALEGEFSWLVCSSANAVYAVKKYLDALGQNVQLPACIKLAAVGKVTAETIKRQLNRQADFVAVRPTGQCLGQTLPLQSGDVVLLPQAQRAHPSLRDALQQRTQHVHAVTAYRSVPHCPLQNPKEIFCGPQEHCVVCFASGSSVTACLAALQKHDAVELLQGCIIACVGQSSIQAATQHQLPIGIACPHASLETLLFKLRERFA